MYSLNYKRIFFKRRLYTLRMNESILVTVHINNLNTLFAQLTSADFKVMENERVELLLYSLLYFYGQLFINMTNNNISNYLSFDEVV
ncbi:hypothetical protein Lal_00001395 [Lupinus albus]|nr:hypothetical protein Lal_00001395 [Lupinus albus]